MTSAAFPFLHGWGRAQVRALFTLACWLVAIGWYAVPLWRSSWVTLFAVTATMAFSQPLWSARSSINTYRIGIGSAVLAIALMAGHPVGVLGAWTIGLIMAAPLLRESLIDTAWRLAIAILAGACEVGVWVLLAGDEWPHWSRTMLAVTAYFVVMTIASTARAMVNAWGDRKAQRESLGHLFYALISVALILDVLLAFLGAGLGRWIHAAAPDVPASTGAVVGLAVITLTAYALSQGLAYHESERRLNDLRDVVATLPWSAEQATTEYVADLARRLLRTEDVEFRAGRPTSRWAMAVATPYFGTDHAWLVAHPRRGAGPFDASDRLALQTLSSIAQVAITVERTTRNLQTQTLTDPLTGLLNYRGMLTALTDLNQSLPPGTLLTVQFIDGNGFKAVNDTYGHEAGDQVLVELAHRTAAWLGPHDLAARAGGDEFVVLLVADANAQVAQARATAFVRAVTQPIDVAGNLISPELSFGVANGLVPLADPSTLIAQSDRFMYNSRGIDIPSVPSGSAVAEPPPQGQRSSSVVDVVREAIQRASLSVAYQPIIDLTTNQVCGAEALVRLSSATTGTIPAEVVVHEARRQGLLGPLTEQVLSQALTDGFRFARSAERSMRMHVNVEPFLLQLPALHRTAGALRIPGHRVELVLELTENSLATLDAACLEQIDQLKRRGVLFALDDFGRAHAHLNSLLQIPFDVIKTDRSLLAGLERSPRAFTVLEGVARMARGLGADCLIEGVQTAAEESMARRSSARFAQGFFYGRPVSADAFSAALVSGQFAIS